MKILHLILILSFTCACAAQKVAVNNADTLISYQVTKRLPLYSEQKKKLDTDIDEFLQRSKSKASEILPVIDEIDLKDPGALDSQYKRIEAFYKYISADFSVLMSLHMAKLDKIQQEEFFSNMADENRDLEKKNKRDLIKEVEERFDQFLGDLTDNQKNIIRSYDPYYQERAEKRLENRKKLYQVFKDIYAQEASPDAKAKLFQEAFVKYQNESIDSNKNVEILQKLIPTIDQSQREYFRNKASEIRELIKYYLTVNY